MPVAMHTGHMERYREVAAVLTEEGFGAFASRLGLPSARGRHGAAPGQDATTPQRLRHSLERLGPTAVKIGQMLSVRADVLPSEYREELLRLQDEAAPIPYEAVARVVEEELGAPPGLVFASFSAEPLAAASIGQVHAAVLGDGTEVAVKVQRPGVRALVETDLEIIESLVRRASDRGLIPESIDAPDIADQFAEAIRHELDYITEGGNADRFYAGFLGDPSIVIPRVHWAYTTSRVLTLDRLLGTPFNRLRQIDQDRIDRPGLACRGIRAYMKQTFELGFFHADPQPGNLFAMPDGRVGFTDFGRVGTVSPGVADAATDVLLAIIDRDADLATDALIEISREPGRIDADRMRRQVSSLIGKYHGTQLGQIQVGEVIQDMLGLVRENGLSLPSDLVMLMATMAVLESVGREVDPGFDFVRVARPYAQGVMRKELEPRELASRFVRAGRRSLRTLSDLPSSVDRALRRVGEGEFHVALRPEAYDGFIRRVEELADRLAFAIIIAAFVIGFSALVSDERLPAWVHALSGVGMLAASGVALWIFASIFTARWRGRD